MTRIRKTRCIVTLTALTLLPVTFGCSASMMHHLATFADTKAWECTEVLKPSAGSALASGLTEKCGKRVNVSPVAQAVQIGEQTHELAPGSIVTQCASKAYVEASR